MNCAPTVLLTVLRRVVSMRFVPQLNLCWRPETRTTNTAGEPAGGRLYTASLNHEQSLDTSTLRVQLSKAVSLQHR